MGTKNNPGKFDCYATAEPDEPMFVLLARDPLAPVIVDLWATLMAARRVRPNEVKLQEARDCAKHMRVWKRERDVADALTLDEALAELSVSELDCYGSLSDD